MVLDQWLVSLQRAWQDVWFRSSVFLLSLAVLIGVTLGCWWLWSQVARGQQMFIVHYSVYFGVDGVHPWSWFLSILLGWTGLTMIDVVGACLCYRSYKALAWLLLGVSAAWSLSLVFVLWHLVQLNSG